MIHLSSQWIENAFLEDAPFGDPASEMVASSIATTEAELIAKEEGVICGTNLLYPFFRFLDPEANIEIFSTDGQLIKPNQKLCTIKCSPYAMLRTERIVLNLLSYLSGIATATQKLANIIAPYGVKLLDTRKILPHYRFLVKYAVRTGGGFNHRNSLSDLIMLKDNHIRAAGGISYILQYWKDHGQHPMLKTEIEVRTLEEALEALPYHPHVLMLDNFSLEKAKEAIDILKQKVAIEVSGGITEENIEQYAKLEPDFISVGSITHSVKSMDYSLNIIEQ